jgi:hypothetical protein
MKEMKDFMEELNDFRSLMQGAKEETRTYNKTSSNVYKPEKARFKAVIYRKDGQNRYYYSYDTKVFNKERHEDEYEGLLKLMRLIHKYKGEYKNAVIYATLEPSKATNSNYTHQIAFFNMFGNTYTNNAVTFKVVERNNLLNLEHLKIYGKTIINK